MKRAPASSARNRGGSGERDASVATAAAVLAAVAVALGAGAAAAEATTPGSIAEFSSGLQTGSRPVGIAPGPDGAMWFADSGSTTSAIGRISMAGQIAESSGSSYLPEELTAAADGNVWFTDDSSSPLGRITVTGQIDKFSSGLPSGSSPDAITLGPDGNVWFTDDFASTGPAIGRITPSGQITEYPIGAINPSSHPGGIAAGPDGNLWFTDSGGTVAIGRIDPSLTSPGTSDGITEFPITSMVNPGGSSPVEITAGADGNMWFTDRGGTVAIGRITPSGQITEFPTGASTLPFAIAPGADGKLWFTGTGFSPTIGSITTGGEITLYALPPGSAPGEIAPGPDGNMWFTDDGTTSAIGQIGTGATAAAQLPPAVSGSILAGSAVTCAEGTWSTWAGEQPSLGASAVDGYSWLLDGIRVAGQTGATFTPTAGQVGQQLSCEVTVTYPLPLFVTTSATSAARTVLAESPLPPSTAPTTTTVPALTRLRVFPHKLSLAGRVVAGRCVKPTRQNNSRKRCTRPSAAMISYVLNEPDRVIFTLKRSVAGRRIGGRCVRPSAHDRRAHRCSRWVAVPGRLVAMGAAGANRLALGDRIGGHELKRGAYRLTALPAAGKPLTVTITIVA